MWRYCAAALMGLLALCACGNEAEYYFITLVSDADSGSASQSANNDGPQRVTGRPNGEPE